jgi:DNA-binding transcriptional LysR family regulator
MHFTLHQLQILEKVAEKQSVTAAAEELHLTQPAISIQLRNLQNQFDIPLIETIGRNIFITDFGKEVVKSSRKILEEVEQINYKTLAYRGHLVGQLKLSVVSTAKYVIPYFLTDFLREAPGIKLKMDVTNKAKVIQSLERNEVDFAMVSVLPDRFKIDRIELMKNMLYLVGSSSEFKDKTSIRAKSLEKLPLIFREKGSATRQAMENYIMKNKIETKKKIELTSNEAVKQAVLAGIGFSVMPLIGIKNELNNGDLKIIKTKGLPITTNWNLIWLKDKSFTPAAQAYVDYLKERKDEVIHERFGWYENY